MGRPSGRWIRSGTLASSSALASSTPRPIHQAAAAAASCRGASAFQAAARSRAGPRVASTRGGAGRGRSSGPGPAPGAPSHHPCEANHSRTRAQSVDPGGCPKMRHAARSKPDPPAPQAAHVHFTGEVRGHHQHRRPFASVPQAGQVRRSPRVGRVRAAATVGRGVRLLCSTQSAPLMGPPIARHCTRRG